MTIVLPGNQRVEYFQRLAQQLDTMVLRRMANGTRSMATSLGNHHSGMMRSVDEMSLAWHGDAAVEAADVGIKHATNSQLSANQAFGAVLNAEGYASYVEGMVKQIMSIPQVTFSVFEEAELSQYGVLAQRTSLYQQRFNEAETNAQTAAKLMAEIDRYGHMVAGQLPKGTHISGPQDPPPDLPDQLWVEHYPLTGDVTQTVINTSGSANPPNLSGLDHRSLADLAPLTNNSTVLTGPNAGGPGTGYTDPGSSYSTNQGSYSTPGGYSTSNAGPGWSSTAPGNLTPTSNRNGSSGSGPGGGGSGYGTLNRNTGYGLDELDEDGLGPNDWGGRSTKDDPRTLALLETGKTATGSRATSATDSAGRTVVGGPVNPGVRGKKKEGDQLKHNYKTKSSDLQACFEIPKPYQDPVIK